MLPRHTRRKVPHQITAIIAGLGLAVAGCAGGQPTGGGESQAKGSFTACAKQPLRCNAGEVAPSDQFTYAIEKELIGWNVNDGDQRVQDIVDGAANLYLPSVWTTLPDFKAGLNKDYVESVEQTGEDPQTFEFKINQKAVWNDGTPITADDFIYNWHSQSSDFWKDTTASAAADYANVKSIKATDDGRGFTMVMKKPTPEWQAVFSNQLYPAHIAAEQGDLKTSAGLKKAWDFFSKTVPEFSAGPYIVENYDKDKAITFVPNEKWWGVQPGFKRWITRIITEASEIPRAMANNEVQAAAPQPQVDIINQIKNVPGSMYDARGGLVYEHINFQLDNEFVKDKALRQAIMMAVDRQAMIDKTVGQFQPGLKPHGHLTSFPGMDTYADLVQGTGYGEGNTDAAKKLLTDAGYKLEGEELTTPNGKKVSTLRVLTSTGNQIRVDTAELIKSALKPLGITVKTKLTANLGGDLGSGDWEMAVYAWVLNPRPYSTATSNWTSGTAFNFGHYKNPDYDAAAADATKVATTDPKAGAAKLNEALKMVIEDGAAFPLYQKPQFLMTFDRFANVRLNPTDGSNTYNVAEWGQRKQ